MPGSSQLVITPTTQFLSSSQPPSSLLHQYFPQKNYVKIGSQKDIQYTVSPCALQVPHSNDEETIKAVPNFNSWSNYSIWQQTVKGQHEKPARAMTFKMKMNLNTTFQYQSGVVSDVKGYFTRARIMGGAYFTSQRLVIFAIRSFSQYYPIF